MLLKYITLSASSQIEKLKTFRASF